MFTFAEELIGQSLNPGLVDVTPGKIIWHGDDFDFGENIFGQTIYGKLISDMDQPLQLDWHIKYKGKTSDWHSVYSFGDQLPTYFPNLIKTSVLTGTNYVPHHEVEILQVEFAKSLMGAAEFPIDDYLTNDQDILYYTNGTLSHISPTPDSKGLLPNNPALKKYLPHARHVRWIFFGFNMVLASMIAAFAVSKREQGFSLIQFARNESPVCRRFLILCGIILTAGSGFKIISALGSSRILDTVNWIFPPLTERQLLLAVSVLEITVVTVLACSKNVNLKLLLLFWLGSQFLLYHHGISGAPGARPELGWISDWLPVRPALLDKISMVLALFLFLGSIFFGIRQLIGHSKANG